MTIAPRGRRTGACSWGGEIGGRLDLTRADGIDCSAIVPRTWRAPIVKSRERREREAWLARVPSVVEVAEDGAIASMSFAALPPGRGGGLL